MGALKKLPALKAMTQKKTIAGLQKKVNEASLSELKDEAVWKDNLLMLAKYGERYKAFVEDFIDEKVTTDSSLSFDPALPTVICVVRNDLIRIKLFLNYYRKLGITQFAILDDHSDDGTKEFLLEQSDVAVFLSDNRYTTLRRQVWINRIVATIGIDRWYVIADSDELLDIDGDSLVDYTKGLTDRGINRVKGLLLDMFAYDSLYSNQPINEPEDIVEIYGYYSNGYYYKKTLFDQVIKGGARDLLFFKDNKNSSPVCSKYPLIFIKKGDVTINSHYNFPFDRNMSERPQAIIRHYKFLPGDKQKYIERAKKGNFGNNSIQYKIYASIEDNTDYEGFREKLIKYTGYEALKTIDISKEK